MAHHTKILQSVIRRCYTIAVLLALPSTELAFGQFDSGQISGFVRDSARLVIPGVTITAINEGNRQQRQTVTNDQGYYVFPSLMVGKVLRLL